ncbi:MAG TPA: hypothetical protein VK921_01310 [Anditalea sp.]|nr:hypothetical protein [Anditalea sp.]
MALQDIIRLLLKNWIWLIAIPIVLAVSIFFFTRGAKRVYVSDTTVFTGIASGYSITGSVEADFYSASTAFDNLLFLINSRETKEEVAIRLLSYHLMLEDVNPILLNWNSYLNFQEILPAELRKQLVAPTFGETYDNVRTYYSTDTENEIYELLTSEEDFYSLRALSALVSSRIGTSDIIRIEYETADPAICKHTLELLTDVFINRNRNLREGQTESVVGYYEVEARRAYERLEDIEQRFLEFNVGNNIINYDEQTKNISSHREILYTDFAEVEMQYVAARSALEAIEDRLEQRAQTTLSSNEILELRNRVSSLSSQISDIEIFKQPAPGTPTDQQLQQLRAELTRTTNQIQANVQDYYAQTHTVGGIPSEGLLNEWVRNVIMVEEGAAKLEVMARRKQDFLLEYERMAPLGATLKRIEREIDLAEREYLTFLNSLNSSRLNQQNIALTAQLKIVDPPFLPVKPRSSKRIIFILVGAIGSFMCVFAFLITREFLDDSVRKPSLATKVTGLPVAGIIPLVVEKKFSNAKEEKVLTQLARYLLMKAKERKDRPFSIGLISMNEGEGKSTAIRLLTEKMAKLGSKVVSYKAVDFPNISFIDTDQSSIVFIEFPPVAEEMFPLDLLADLDLILLTIRSNRAWTKADQKSFETISGQTAADTEILLTGVLPEHSEIFG